MRETTSEIKNVIDQHPYSIEPIVFDVRQTVKLYSIVRNPQFGK